MNTDDRVRSMMMEDIYRLWAMKSISCALISIVDDALMTSYDH